MTAGNANALAALRGHGVPGPTQSPDAVPIVIPEAGKTGWGGGVGFLPHIAEEPPSSLSLGERWSRNSSAPNLGLPHTGHFVTLVYLFLKPRRCLCPGTG